jgi:molybdopterin synthase catalytic subunit
MFEPRRPRQELHIVQAEKDAKSPRVEGKGQRKEKRQKEKFRVTFVFLLHTAGTLNPGETLVPYRELASGI